MNIYDNTGKLASSYSNYLTISDNGNTIMLDHSPTPLDTVRYYYYFKKNVIQPYKTYFHYAGNSPLEIVYNYRYDENENLKEIEVIENGSKKHITSVLTVGGKNPTYSASGTTSEFDYTYYSNGYPSILSSKQYDDVTYYEYYK